MTPAQRRGGRDLNTSDMEQTMHMVSIILHSINAFSEDIRLSLGIRNVRCWQEETSAADLDTL